MKEITDPYPNPAPIDYDEVFEGLQKIYNSPDQPLAVDTETTGLGVHDGQDHAIGVSYATVLNGEPISGYVAFRHSAGENAPQHVQDGIKYVLEQGRPLIYQGAQFDILALDTVDIDVKEKPFYDIPSMVNLIDENMPNKSMDMIARKYAPYVKKLTEDEWINHQKITGWPDTTPERIWDYAVNDAEVTYITWLELMMHKEWRDLADGYWDYKQAEIRCLIEMRKRGALLDKEIATMFAEKGEARMREILEELGYEKLGPKALTELLLDRLKLPVIKRSKKTGNPSFDREAMEEYDVLLKQTGSDLGQLIFEYRGWQKAVSAGYRAYLKAVSPDGRVRTEYTTHVTRTGRLSSKEPNLQQIPKETENEWNGQMKACFIAKPGYTLWNIDYSQLELRLMASFAGVDVLKQVFIEGRDLFTEMSEALGYSRDDVKTFVYANSYGAGDRKIAAQLGISVAQAKKMRQDYYSVYPEFRILSKRLENMAIRHKKFPYWSGRFRHMPYSGDAYKAMNSFIQGGGADVVARAMIRIFDEVDNEECQMLMQVHDAFVFEIKNGTEDHYLPRITEIMEDVDTLVKDRLPNGTGTRFAVEAELWPVYEKGNINGNEIQRQQARTSN